MWRDDRGMALVLVLLCAMLFLALGGALGAVVRSEATISATFRESRATNQRRTQGVSTGNGLYLLGHER